MSESGSRVRRPTSWRKVIGLFFGLIFAAIAIGLGGWWLGVRYERRAVLHLPASFRMAARIDVEKVVLHDPVSRHVLPALDAVGRRDAEAEPGARLGRIRERAGINLPRDLREILFACVESCDDWLVVLGGRFPGGTTDGIAAALREEGVEVGLTNGVVSVRGGPFIGQASDGVLVLAARATTARSALETRAAAWPELALGETVARPGEPAVAELSSIVELRGRVLARGGALEALIDVQPRPGGEPLAAAQKLADGLEMRARGARSAGWPLPSLVPARVEPNGAERATLVFSWQPAEIDGAIQAAAARWVLRRTVAPARVPSPL